MSTIPTSITEAQFDQHIRPYLSVAKRGFECKISLHKVFNYILYRLYTGCQWKMIPIEHSADDPATREISHGAVAYHFRKWSRDGSLRSIWQGSIKTILDDLDLSELNLDGTHILAKKGGESVAYQMRKRAKTTNILPMTERNGFIIATTDLIAGNHHDAWNLVPHVRKMLGEMKQLGLNFAAAHFNGDPGFDTKAMRKLCFNHKLIPNIKVNKRNRKKSVRGRPRLFDETVYGRRFTIERTFAWVDKFKALLVRFDRDDSVFLGAHHIVFSMINLRHVFSHAQ